MEHVYSANPSYDYKEKFLDVTFGLFNTRPISLLSLLLFLAGVTIMALPLFSLRRSHPRLHAFVGSLCYAAAALVCDLFASVSYDNMMWPIAALLTVWAYKDIAHRSPSSKD